MFERGADQPTARPPPLGSLIGGKWTTEAVIGRGMMGVVVRARHHELGHPVAIKFLVNTRDAVARERFRREAKIIASLRSEHAVRIIDFGCATVDGDDVEYLVMELLEGETVAAYARRVGRLEVREAAEIVYQTCLAMTEAHARGVVHRDLKPGNLFLSRRLDGAPWVRVLDFGVSKLGGVDESELTATASVLGSPAFMAPEQVRSSKAVDARSDVWALGVTLHRLVAGELPFSASTPVGMCAAVMADPPAKLSATLAPPGLIAAIERALSKDPDARFQTAGELADAIAPFAGRPTRALGDVKASPHDSTAESVRHAPAAVALGVASSVAASATPNEPRSGTRRRVWLAVGAVAVGLALTIGTWALGRATSTPGATDRPPAAGSATGAVAAEPSAAPMEAAPPASSAAAPVALAAVAPAPSLGDAGAGSAARAREPAAARPRGTPASSSPVGTSRLRKLLDDRR